MMPNLQPSVPAPSLNNKRAVEHWVRITFAVGTPVKLGTQELALAGAGTAKGVVSHVDDPADVAVPSVYVRFTDLRDVNGMEVGQDGYNAINTLGGGRGLSFTFRQLVEPYSPLTTVLEPTVDNWASVASPRPQGRHHLPRSQRSWLKPNATVGDLLREASRGDAQAAGRLVDALRARGWNYHDIQSYVQEQSGIDARTWEALLSESESGSIEPNPVPPPPQNPLHQQQWFERTFPVGTSIIWQKDQVWSPAGTQTTYTIPRGIKAEVISRDPTQYGGSPDDEWFVARFLRVLPGTSDPRILQFAQDLEQATQKELHELEFGLEAEDAVNGTVGPLTDTWGPSPRPTPGYRIPRSQRSWMKPNS